MMRRKGLYRNQFYSWNAQQRLAFQRRLGLYCLLGIIGVAIALLLINKYLLLLLPLLIGALIGSIASFFDVPSLIKNGQLKYYSLFLLGEKAKEGVLTVHGGTIFDYYFVLNTEMNAQERAKLILLEYLKGLINLVENEDKGLTIEGTSYIINERTAQKVGFKKVQTNGLQQLILALNYISLVLSISMVKKRLQFPNLGQVSTFSASISDIEKRVPFIKQLILKIENT